MTEVVRAEHVAQQGSNSETAIEDLRRTKNGYAFDVNADYWNLGPGHGIHITSMIRSSLDSQITAALRLVLARSAEEYSAATSRGWVSNFRRFIKDTSGNAITSARLDNWLAQLREQGRERSMTSLRALLILWNEWGYPGIPSEVVDYLERLTLSGHAKGQAVLRKCPYTGPYTMLEQQAIYAWANDAFTDGKIDLQSYAWLFTLMMTARRPIQIKSLRACDLTTIEKTTPIRYRLRIPRAKQLGAQFRDSFRDIEIPEDLYNILSALVQQTRSRVEEHLDIKLPEHVAEQLPIFLQDARLRELDSLDTLEQWLEITPDALHASKFDPLQRLSALCTARSERTGDYIALMPRRFRYSKGTNLSDKGAAATTIAHALDHNDIQHVGIYVENTEETAFQIDELMGEAMAPLAQAFAGTLIASEREAVFGVDPNRRIKNDHNESVGSCGTNAVCFSGHFACYVCPKFQPWIDGPHEQVLEAVLEQRERQKKKSVSPHVMQATDRLLLAVQEVIRLCSPENHSVDVVNAGDI